VHEGRIVDAAHLNFTKILDMVKVEPWKKRGVGGRWLKI